jgi:integrase
MRLPPDQGEISEDTRIKDLIKRWFEGKAPVGGTKTLYTWVIDHKINPVIGELRLSEASTRRLDRFLGEQTPANAKLIRTILNQSFADAVRLGALQRNPAEFTRHISTPRRKVTAMSSSDLAQMRVLFQAWDQNHASSLDALLVILMATGVRTGELLAFRWEDVDLDAGEIRVTGTMKGSYRQPWPKSESSKRALILPKTAIGVLMDLSLSAAGEPVFPTQTGTFQSEANMRRSWRAAIAGSRFEGKSPRDVRKAVATLLDERVDKEAAKSQLGHSSSKITEAYYIADKERVANFGTVLEDIFQSG